MLPFQMARCLLLTQSLHSVDFESLRLKVVTEATPWPSDVSVKQGSINSFGYGGTNSHAIISEAVSVLPESKKSSSTPPPTVLLIYSARSQAALKQNILSIQDVSHKYSIEDLAYTLCERRTLHFHRAYAVYPPPNISVQPKLTQRNHKAPMVGLIFTG